MDLISTLIIFLCISTLISIAYLFFIAFKKAKEAHERALLNPKTTEQQIVEAIPMITGLLTGIFIMMLLNTFK